MGRLLMEKEIPGLEDLLLMVEVLYSISAILTVKISLHGKPGCHSVFPPGLVTARITPDLIFE
jgi:acetylornithine deacetylase/succinyl-diaminopimelate desuccinylase-like protein